MSEELKTAILDVLAGLMYFVGNSDANEELSALLYNVFSAVARHTLLEPNKQEVDKAVDKLGKYPEYQTVVKKILELLE